MGVGKAGLVLLAVGTAFSITACGGGGGGGGDTRLVTDFSACDTKPDVGSSALYQNSTRTEFVVSRFFEKPYDRYDLEAVLDASSTSTTTYVQSLGISLYRIPRESMKGQCPTYFNLAAPNAMLKSIWSEAAGGNTGDGKLAGLFFELCGGGGGTPACRAREMVQPTILVDEASDRWTLVHEMMHYNFNQARKASAEMPTTQKIERNVQDAVAKFKKSIEDFEKLPNRGDLQTATDSLRTLIESGKQIYVRRSLEEMTIEGMLIDLWASGDFKNVANGAPASGVWYMNFSRDQFLQTLSPFDKACDELKTRADANFWPEISSDADAMKTMIEDSRTETGDMIETAKAKIKRVQRSTDEGQFLNARGRLGFTVTDASNETTFDAAKADSDARAAALRHLASHDNDGLQKSFDKATQDVAIALKKLR
ncbi:hypothetical protein BH10BDE1_BH10BDE1_27080 [soil metagenome]